MCVPDGLCGGSCVNGAHVMGEVGLVGERSRTLTNTQILRGNMCVVVYQCTINTVIVSIEG